MNDSIWNNVYNDFPINRQLIWLNNCGSTPCGVFAAKAVREYLDCCMTGSYSEEYAPGRIKRDIQAILAALFKTEPQDIALLHNTAEGMNLLSLGLDLAPGDEILILENEYPSNVYPWEHWTEKGVKLKFAAGGSSEAEFLNNFKNSISRRTKVAALSAVHWCSGMCLPLEETADICAAEGILLILDSAQAAGHIPLDIARLNCLSAFSAWKWLLGPAGLGVLVVPKHKLGELRPVFKGTGSVSGNDEYLPYKKTLKENAQRYMYSTPSFLDWVYFRASLQYLSKIGFARVMRRLSELANYLSTGLRSAGFQLLSDGYRQKTAITVAAKQGTSAAELVQRLKKHNILVRERQGRVRFGPHIYNSFAQLDNVLNILETKIC